MGFGYSELSVLMGEVVRMNKFLLLFVVLLLSACGSKIEGKYVGQGFFAATSFTFQPNGKAVLDNMGMKVEIPYEIAGSQLKIMAMGGITTTIKEDGTFEIPGAGIYKKM